MWSSVDNDQRILNIHEQVIKLCQKCIIHMVGTYIYTHPREVSVFFKCSVSLNFDFQLESFVKNCVLLISIEQVAA